MEKSLYSVHASIRHNAFKALRIGTESRQGVKSEKFAEYCKNLVLNIRNSTNQSFEENLDLLETITSLEYIDFYKLRGKPQKIWKRELLLSDLTSRHSLSLSKGIDFYSKWLAVEEKINNLQYSEELLLTLRDQQNLDYKKLIEALSYVIKLDLNTLKDTFTKSSNIIPELKSQSIKVELYRILKNVNNNYIADLTNQLSNGSLPIVVLNILLEAIKPTNNVKELTDLLDFAASNHIT